MDLDVVHVYNYSKSKTKSTLTAKRSLPVIASAVAISSRAFLLPFLLKYYFSVVLYT